MVSQINPYIKGLANESTGFDVNVLARQYPNWSYILKNVTDCPFLNVNGHKVTSRALILKIGIRDIAFDDIYAIAHVWGFDGLAESFGEFLKRKSVVQSFVIEDVPSLFAVLLRSDCNGRDDCTLDVG